MAEPWRALSEQSTFAGSIRVVRSLHSTSARRALYLAEQTGIGRACALRVLDPRLISSAAGKARFDELRALRARIKSDHVVDVVAAGVDRTTGAPWFALDHLEGETLSAHAAAPLPPAEALEVLWQVAHGLAAIHDAGQVHGTLDPSSIIVATSRYAGSDFTVTLLDFWTSSWLRSADANAEGSDVASLFWSAPEQTEPGSAVTAAADVWAFGLLAFRLLTGKIYWKSAAQPEQATPVAVLKEVSVADLPRASRRAAELGVETPLPEGFDEWFARCVARSVDDRFKSVAEAVGALEPILDRDAPVAAAAVARAPKRAAGPGIQRHFSSLYAWARSTDVVVPAVLTALLVVAFGVRGHSRARWPWSRSRAEAPVAATALPAPTPSPVPTTARTPDAGPPTPQPVNLTESGAQAIATRLGSIPRGSPVWITVAAADPAAEALGQRLLGIFERAGWQTHPLGHSEVRARPGIFLFAAEEQSPGYVETVERALTDAHLAPTVARGYRSFYAEMRRDNPSYRGFPFEADQTFLIVLGRGQ